MSSTQLVTSAPAYYSGGVFRDAETGVVLEGYVGLVLVLSSTLPALFRTGFKQGERTWDCLGTDVRWVPRGGRHGDSA